jgi:hypothetical protein
MLTARCASPPGSRARRRDAEIELSATVNGLHRDDFIDNTIARRIESVGGGRSARSG